MFDIGAGELLLILIFVLVAFGPKKIPELSRSLGRGIREFKKAQREFADHINTAFAEEEMRSQRVPRPANTIAQRSAQRPTEPAGQSEAYEGAPQAETSPDANGNAPAAMASHESALHEETPSMEQPAGTVHRGTTAANHDPVSDSGERDQSNERHTG